MAALNRALSCVQTAQVVLSRSQRLKVWVHQSILHYFCFDLVSDVLIGGSRISFWTSKALVARP
jgi:hypothetical protein